MHANLTGPYTGDRVKFNLTDGSIQVNTSEPFVLALLLSVKTECSKPFYLPLHLTVEHIQKVEFNSPPYFEIRGDNQIDFMVKRSEKQSQYKFEFNIGKQLDDHDELAYINFTSNDFGTLRFKYDGPLVNQINSDRLNILKFDPQKNKLTVTFQNGYD